MAVKDSESPLQVYPLQYWLTCSEIVPTISPLERRLLLAAALNKTRVWLAQHPEYCPSATEQETIKTLYQRRTQGEPIAYLLQEREFYGLSLRITPAVLIPRPETELLIDLALARIAPEKAARVLDLGTGSGCMALSLAHTRPRALIYGVDRSVKALQLAVENQKRLGFSNLFWLGSHWLTALSPRIKYDVIVSNPPYIDAADPHLQQGDLRFEPKMALTPGENGLAALQEIIAAAPDHLAPEGWLLLEHGYQQGDALRQYLQKQKAQWRNVVTYPDLAGLPRATVAQIAQKL